MEKHHDIFRKPVAQEDDMGCAIASVAFVLGVSYKKALFFFKDGKIRAMGIPNFYCPELVEILNNNGLDYSWVKINNKNKKLVEKELSIVFCEQSSELPVGHFLVRHQNKWMDPWFNLPNQKRKADFKEKLPGKPTYVVYLK